MAKLSVLLGHAASAAMHAADGGPEQTRHVKALRKLWREAKRIGFPLADADIEKVDHLIRRIDLRKESPSFVLRGSVAPLLHQLQKRARWAEAAVRPKLTPYEDQCPSCEQTLATEPHACSRRVELEDDPETECQCCYDCAEACRLEV